MDVQIQEFTTYLNCGILPQRSDEIMGHPFINSPYGIHKTKDGYLALAMTPFEKLSKALECNELMTYQKWVDGQTYKDEIFNIVSKVLETKNTSEWIEQLDAHDVWCGPVYTYEEVEADPQIQHNKTIQVVHHPKYGDLKVVANPITFSDTPVSYQMGPPDLGEHNADILRELGYSEEKIDLLKKDHIIQREQPKTYKI